MTSLLQPRLISSMRPISNKEVEAVDLDDLFSQYLETDLLQFSDTTVDPSSSDDLPSFEMSANDNESGETATTIGKHAWQSVSPSQHPASPVAPAISSSVYPISRGKASLSDPEILSFDDLFESDELEPRSSISTPPTPTTQLAKPARRAESNPERPRRTGVHKSVRKVTSLAKMVSPPAHFYVERPDAWPRQIHTTTDSFNLGSNLHELPRSELSDKLVQGHTNIHSYPRGQPCQFPLSPFLEQETPDFTQSHYQLTPSTSPAIDHNETASAYIHHAPFTSALQTPPPSHRLQMTTWHPEPSSSLVSSFSASPDLHALQGRAQGWVGGAGVQPQPHPPSLSQTENQNQSFEAGLGITCDDSSFAGFEQLNSNQVHGTINDGFLASASSYDVGGSTLQAPTIANGISIGQPLSPTSQRGNLSFPPQSPSLTDSPTCPPQPQLYRRRPSSQQNLALRSANRRKSTSNLSSSQSNSHHQRSSSSGADPFVNLGPRDSRKILTGVAPSGSSKTKARREKEAAEKRRKFSEAAMKAIIEAGGNQAAMKAILDAGGDAEALEREGLLLE